MSVELDTVAFFPIIRGKHTFHAVDKIMNTTQLFLDVYSDHDIIYVRPSKVWERNSETMFLPHIYDKEDGSFRPILDKEFLEQREKGGPRYKDSLVRKMITRIEVYKNRLIFTFKTGTEIEIKI